MHLVTVLIPHNISRYILRLETLRKDQFGPSKGVFQAKIVEEKPHLTASRTVLASCDGVAHRRRINNGRRWLHQYQASDVFTSAATSDIG
jgi:hypothetical protein